MKRLFLKRICDKKSLKYLDKVFCNSKNDIIRLWCFDAIDMAYDWVQPLLIGCAIDGLINQRYIGLIILIVLYLINVVINYFNNTNDDIVYNTIKSEFRVRYYENALKRNLNTSTIEANIELVDKPVEFIRCFCVNYLNCIGMLCFSLFFILNNFSFFIKIYVVALSIVAALIGICFNKKQIPNLNKLYSIKEKQRDKIGSRNSGIYKNFLNKMYSLNIYNSIIDSKGILFMNFITVCLLAGSLFLFTKEANITLGIMYSGIEYIFMLISSFDMIPDLYYEYKDVSLCIDKIDL